MCVCAVVARLAYFHVIRVCCSWSQGVDDRNTFVSSGRPSVPKRAAWIHTLRFYSLNKKDDAEGTETLSRTRVRSEGLNSLEAAEDSRVPSEGFLRTQPWRVCRGQTCWTGRSRERRQGRVSSERKETAAEARAGTAIRQPVARRTAWSKQSGSQQTRNSRPD